MKVFVVGAGIIGASIAYHLAREGAKVVVLEKSSPAAEASSKSLGWLNASYGNAAPYFDLRMRSLLEFARLDRELDGALPLQWGGGLWWEDDEAEMAEAYAQQTAWGYPVRWLGREEITALEPALADPPPRAILAESEGTLDCEAATKVLLDAAIARGAELKIGVEVMDIKQGQDGVVLQTSEGEFTGERVALAAGVATEFLAARCGIKLPMANLPGMLARSKPIAPCVKRMILSPDLHFKQDLDGSLVLGWDFGGGPVPNDLTADGLALLAEAQKLLRGIEELELDNVTVGLRPIPADGHPIIGFLPAMPGLYVAVMHSGATLMPVVGRMAALEILKNVETEILGPFRPGRFHD